MTIPKSYEALAADLASEKIISKTLQGQKEAYMMLADSRKIELDDALARETELKSGLKTTLNDLHGRDDAVYDLRIDLKAAQDRESALREELESIKASVDGYDSPEHAAQVADEMGYQCIALQKRLTVAERRESEAREELLDLSRKLDVFYSRSHGIKNLSTIEDANDKSKALQQRLTVSEQRADDLESLVRDVEPMVAKKHSSPWFAKRYAALKPAAEGEGS